ncbi:MAG: hypothetical protein ACJAXS_002846 [Colwellia sp.]|jgi:hypothetical protein
MMEIFFKKSVDKLLKLNISHHNQRAQIDIALDFNKI